MVVTRTSKCEDGSVETGKAGVGLGYGASRLSDIDLEMAGPKGTSVALQSDGFGARYSLALIRLKS